MITIQLRNDVILKQLVSFLKMWECFNIKILINVFDYITVIGK